MNNIDIIGNIDPRTLGGKDSFGYEYKLVQTTTDGVIYTMTDPTGDSRVFTLGSREIIQEMVASPKTFWENYIRGTAVGCD